MIKTDFEMLVRCCSFSLPLVARLHGRPNSLYSFPFSSLSSLTASSSFSSSPSSLTSTSTRISPALHNNINNIGSSPNNIGVRFRISQHISFPSSSSSSSLSSLSSLLIFRTLRTHPTPYVDPNDGSPLLPKQSNDKKNISLLRRMNNRINLYFVNLREDIRPYADLIRLRHPTGWILLAIPCYWGVIVSSPLGLWPNLDEIFLYTFGAFVMRNAGVIINDLIDRKVDASVERTKYRPLASGVITVPNALLFLAVHLFAGACVLFSLNSSAILAGICSLPLVALYPFMKRITHWPQLILGAAFNIGIPLTWLASRGDFSSMLGSASTGTVLTTSTFAAFPDLWVVLPLYCSGILWTLVYDTIYAHQDKRDDQTIGVKSTALLFGKQSKSILSAFTVASTACLLLSGYNLSLHPSFYAGASLSGALLLSIVRSVNWDDPNSCARGFKRSQLFGWTVAVSLLLGIILGEPAFAQRPFSYPYIDELNY